MILALIGVAMIAVGANAEQLTVTLYNHAKMPKDVIDDASFDLRSIFRRANINLDIRIGNPSSQDSFTVAYLGRIDPGSLSDVACHARLDVGLEILHSPPGLGNHVLGMAFPLAARGLNARVFADHVGTAAFVNGRSYSAVLAYVIAHEIGHVLLKTQPHSSHGIMAEMWSPLEYQLMAFHQLPFGADQATAMRAMLDGRGCPTKVH